MIKKKKKKSCNFTSGQQPTSTLTKTFQLSSPFPIRHFFSSVNSSISFIRNIYLVFPPPYNDLSYTSLVSYKKKEGKKKRKGERERKEGREGGRKISKCSNQNTCRILQSNENIGGNMGLFRTYWCPFEFFYYFFIQFLNVSEHPVLFSS